MQGKKEIVTATLISLSCMSAVTAADRKTNSYNEVVRVDSSRVYDIDEIIVVSQPKENVRLREQPIASSSFSANDINSLGTTDLRALSSFVPSFTMPDYGSRLTSAMYLRGIGSRVNSPAIGIYYDDMPIMSKSALNFHSYQISRIDVLPGPQGTLYGQNTEGGLVRIYTKNPLLYKGTEIKLGLGSHLQRTAEFAHYGKARNSLSYSIAAFYDGQNGYLRNAYTGGRADCSNEGGGRFRLEYAPMGHFSFRLIADYQHTSQNGFAYGQLDMETGHAAQPSTNYQGNYQRDMVNTGFMVKYKQDSYEVNSMTTYQYLNDDMLMDQDYLPEDFMHLRQRQIQNSLAEELTIKSGKDAWKWTNGLYASYQWLKTSAPVYFGEGITRPISNGIQKAMYGAILGKMTEGFIAQGMSPEAAAGAAKAAIEKAGGIGIKVNMDVPGTFRTPQLNLGLFHESSIRIGNHLTATAGLRYDFSQTKIRYNTSAMMAMTANVMGKTATNKLKSALDNDDKADFSQVLPKVGLTYRIDRDGSNLYATVSKGYRAGGYNIQMFSDILQTELNTNSSKAMQGNYDVPHDADTYERINKSIAYKPETSWNYEMGAHLNLIGKAMHLDIAAFYMNVENQQLSVMAGNYGFGRMMINAGKSRSMGLEVSVKGHAANNRLAWAVGYGLTNSVFKDYKDSVKVGNNKVEKDYKDKKVPYVPEHTLSGNASYRIDLERGIIKSVTFGANVTAQGRTYWDEANTYSQPFYAVANLYATIDFGKASIRLWGQNITDCYYNTFAIGSSATGTKKYFAQRGRPFMFGAEANIRL